MDKLVTLRVQEYDDSGTDVRLHIGGMIRGCRYSVPTSAVVSVEDAPVEFQLGDVYRAPLNADSYVWQREEADRWLPIGHGAGWIEDHNVLTSWAEGKGAVYRLGKPL